MKIKLTIFLALFLCMGSVGCEDKENKDIYPDAKIIKELPLRTSLVCKDLPPKVQIINSQKELDDLFEGAKLPDFFINIDFNKYSLILGNFRSSQGIGGFEHQFTKIGSKKYEYILTVWDAATQSPECATFGIIIDKIPSDSEIIFNVKKTV